MSEWNIILGSNFKSEVRGIYKYIAEDLLVPETADNRVRRIMNAVNSLSDMPSRFALYDKDKPKSHGMRKMTVDNYIVFYHVDEKNREVVILHIFYGGRNVDDILKKH